MKDTYKTGAILAALGILTAVLAFFFLAGIYNPTIEGKILAGRLDEANTVRIVFALVGWLGYAAGAVWGVVLYGFVLRRDWAWVWGSVAAMLQILAGLFPVFPPASIGLPFPTIWVFLLAIGLWFSMLRVGRVEKPRLALAFAGGMAYMLSFMDGVGSIPRLQAVTDSFPNGIYTMGQMLNWWGAAAWGVFIFALLARKPWALIAGLLAAQLAIAGGLPLAVTDMLRLGRFSMFLPSPVFSGLLLLILLSQRGKMILGGIER